MKLLCIFIAVLALSVAEENAIPETDSYVASMELLRMPKNSYEEILEPAANAHHYVSNTKSWNPHYNVPPQYISGPPASDYVPPVSNYVPLVSNYVPPVSNYLPPVNNYVPLQNDYVSPKNSYVPLQNNYYPPRFWNTYFPTGTPSVIKNEYIHGDNGSYKYEYQITDGTHVGEVGYFTNPHQTDDSFVKKGWYSYVGADGKTKTVYYWADHTGFHVYGKHLPTSPHIAYSAEAEKNEAQAIYPTHPTYNLHHH